MNRYSSKKPRFELSYVVLFTCFLEFMVNKRKRIKKVLQSFLEEIIQVLSQNCKMNESSFEIRLRIMNMVWIWLVTGSMQQASKMFGNIFITSWILKVNYFKYELTIAFVFSLLLYLSFYTLSSSSIFYELQDLVDLYMNVGILSHPISSNIPIEKVIKFSFD